MHECKFSVTDLMWERTVTFESTFEAVDREVRRYISLLKEIVKDLDSGFFFELDFVLREILNNAVEHGNGMDISKPVIATLRVGPQALCFIAKDSGPGFNIEEMLSKARCADVLEVRNRGLLAIEQLGFTIHTDVGVVRLELKGEYSLVQRSGGRSMEITAVDGTIFIAMTKDLTAPNIKEYVELLKGLSEAAIESCTAISLDMGTCEAIDSMGVTFLIGLYKVYREREVECRLTGVSSSIMKLFKIMKLDTLYKIELKESI